MKYIKITCLIVLLAIGSGCKKWLDVNQDPATPQNVDPEFYLAPIIAQMAIGTGTDYVQATFKYTQNFGAQVAADPMERHNWSNNDLHGGTLWRFTYVNAGLNLEDLINKSVAKQNNTLAAVGYAIKAWGFQMSTDSYGPIILDEAFKDQLTFKYQDQPVVYNKVREWCYQSLALLNKEDVLVNPALLRANDYLFGSTIPANNSLTVYKDRWRKFVYALLATQYSHLINKSDFNSKYADSVVKFVNLSFGGTISSSSEDAAINFEGVSAANANPFSVIGNLPNSVSTAAGVASVASGRVAQPIVNYLTGGVKGTPAVNPTTSLDPRLSRMINPMATGVYKGVIPAKGDAPATKTIPHIYGSVAAIYPGKYIFGQGVTDKPRYPLYTYSQLQFAKAEALFLKGDVGGAWTAYDKGIRGHMEFVNLYGRFGTTVAPAITATEIAAYMASDEVAQNASTLTMADIMGQKYIAQWGWAGQEQWCDLRKWHYRNDIFRQFKQLDAGDFSTNVGGVGQYAYRFRPRFNSEYVWNRAELDKWGGLSPLYSYQETWFSTPLN
ncbi:SusD/RagB family nutrient-binding outer membrane lipoprotein [Pedobacter sp. Hv1]|uniref:SusD/RagB family nutrient-binding outer membrane lipoprotein n=1 Tax=Pedobacter sp. Hv1 TaxID=1740090 RepID=UPI0006D89D96|nr:SusD/RagB family nutrient-binding outer membrane lipoprotein [Pedobacter sp. Hv1]KQC01477.1 hypothetical protein AQF98_07155 [Pedobacter sp. Hv1]